LAVDLEGGYIDGAPPYRRQLYEVDDARIMPDAGPDRDGGRNQPPMPHYERMRKTWETVHIANGDIKDIAEDVETIARDLATVWDLEGPLMKEGIKRDAAARYEPHMQQMLKMIIEDTKDFDPEEALEQAGEKMRLCPRFQRLRKTIERVVREICRDVEVADLPTGRRMEWVNRLARDIHHTMKSDEPVRGIYRDIEPSLRRHFRELERWVEEADRMERNMKKNGAFII